MTDKKSQERFQPDVPAIIDHIRIGRDEFVNKIRWSCVTEQEESRLEQDNTTFIERGLTVNNVTMPEVCETAADEAARRDIFDGLYELYQPNNPRGAWEKIMQQALNNSTDTGIPITYGANKGRNHALTCSLAFEAGYRFGTENPTKDPAPQATPEAIAAGVKQCLREGSTLSRRDGLVLGTKRAQARGEDITLLEVPDVREAETLSR